jgi:hypothetical protein
MSFTVTFVAVPATLALFVAIFVRHRLYPGLHELADRVFRGAFWGLAGTIAYDVSRPLIVWLFGFPFGAFAAIPAYGSMMTGLPVDHPAAVVTGWLYHVWNGVSFGMLFATVRPRGGPLAGCVWGFVLQALFMATLPQLALAVRLDTPGFVFTGFAGHTFWGLVLGAGLAGRFRGALPTWGSAGSPQGDAGD